MSTIKSLLCKSCSKIYNHSIEYEHEIQNNITFHMKIDYEIRNKYYYLYQSINNNHDNGRDECDCRDCRDQERGAYAFKEDTVNYDYIKYLENKKICRECFLNFFHLCECGKPISKHNNLCSKCILSRIYINVYDHYYTNLDGYDFYKDDYNVPSIFHHFYENKIFNILSCMFSQLTPIKSISDFFTSHSHNFIINKYSKCVKYDHLIQINKLLDTVYIYNDLNEKWEMKNHSKFPLFFRKVVHNLLVVIKILCPNKIFPKPLLCIILNMTLLFFN